jgi:hypothetical protein
MRHFLSLRRPAGIALFAAVAALLLALFAYPVAANFHTNTGHQSRVVTFQSHTLQEKVKSHELASTVHVLQSLPPSVIVQFPLYPSGVKAKFPNAKGVVTIIQGNPEVSLFDTVTVDVENMPPNITFTVFFIELANKPFGHVQYAADLHTREDGSGEIVFQSITLVAFAADARNPGLSKDQSGNASGTQLEHLGMWFSSLQDAQKVLNDKTLKGTPFDGGSPPLHAGPQALTDGQNAPVF